MRVSGKDVLESFGSSGSSDTPLGASDSQSEGVQAEGVKGNVQLAGIDAVVDARNWLNLRDSVWGFQGTLQSQGLQSSQGISSVSPQNTISGAPSNAVRLPTGPAPLMFQ
jgi:hypothetical protein